MPNTAKLVPENVAQHLPGLTVLTSPNFIIEQDGDLYLAVGVLKYSEREADAERDPALKEQKKQGVAKVRRMFEEGLKSSNLDCCEVKFAASASSILESGEGDTTPPGMNTEPPGMNTSP
jgi:hypothetical protein